MKAETMDEITLTLNSPITEEQYDMIQDVDFDHTDSIAFCTKHGKEVEFVKRKTGRISYTHFSEELWGQSAICLSCGCKWQIAGEGEDNFCPNCGRRMVNEDW